MTSVLRRLRTAAGRYAHSIAVGLIIAALILATAWGVTGWDGLGALALALSAGLGGLAWLQSRRLRLAMDTERTRSQQAAKDAAADRAELLVSLYEATVQDNGTIRLPRRHAGDVVPVLLRRGDLIRAFRLAEQTGTLADLGVGRLRSMGERLRHRGYLTPAIVTLGQAQDLAPSDEVAQRLTATRAELELVSGCVGARCTAPSTRIEPLTGRVLHVVGSSRPDAQTGYTVRTSYIVESQKRAGLNPRVSTPPGFPSTSDTLRVDDVDGIIHYRLAGPSRGEGYDAWLRAYVDGLLEIVREWRPAVLHAASDFLNAQAATIVARAAGIPVVYEVRGFWEETWLSRHGQITGRRVQDILEAGDLPEAYTCRRATEDRFRLEADRVVTLAPVMAEEMVARGLDRSRITVVPNAVDPASFPAVDRDPLLAASLGIPPGAVVVGYVSTLTEYEGIDDLVRGFDLLRSGCGSDTPVVLLVVGDGAEKARLEALATGLGLGSAAVFTGKVPHSDVLNYYGLIDIFVVPRKPVPVCQLVTPLKPYEAFATGRAVVMSDVAALKGIAVESGAAETFTAGDPVSLSQVLSRLVRDPERRAEMGSQGRAWVQENRTWEHNANTYLALYAELGVV